MSDDTLPRHAAAGITEGIHIAYSFTVADAAAMAAGSVVDPGPGTRTVDVLDEGKIARRVDTGRYHWLVSASPPRWRLADHVPGIPGTDPDAWDTAPNPALYRMDAILPGSSSGTPFQLSSVNGVTGSLTTIEATDTTTTYSPFTASPKMRITTAASENAIAENFTYRHNTQVKNGSAWSLSQVFGWLEIAPTLRAFAGPHVSVGGQGLFDPLASANFGGFRLAVMDGGNWHSVACPTSGSPVATDLGSTWQVQANTLYRLSTWATGLSEINWRLTNMNSGAAVSGVASTGLPSAPWNMRMRVWSTRAAGGAVAHTMDVCRQVFWAVH